MCFFPCFRRSKEPIVTLGCFLLGPRADSRFLFRDSMELRGRSLFVRLGGMIQIIFCGVFTIIDSGPCHERLRRKSCTTFRRLTGIALSQNQYGYAHERTPCSRDVLYWYPVKSPLRNLRSIKKCIHKYKYF